MNVMKKELFVLLLLIFTETSTFVLNSEFFEEDSNPKYLSQNNIQNNIQDNIQDNFQDNASIIDSLENNDPENDLDGSQVDILGDNLEDDLDDFFENADNTPQIPFQPAEPVSLPQRYLRLIGLKMLLNYQSGKKLLYYTYEGTHSWFYNLYSKWI